MATDNDRKARLKAIEHLIANIPTKATISGVPYNFEEAQLDRAELTGRVELANAIRKILHAPVPGGDTEKALEKQQREDAENAQREATAAEVYERS